MISLSRRLNATQVLALKCLQKSYPDGLTRVELEKRVAMTISTAHIGAIHEEEVDEYPNSLRALRLVTCKDMSIEEDEAKRCWFITSKGLELYPSLKVKTRGSYVKIPNEILDPAVKAIRLLRSYGLESFNHDDLEELRAQCGEEYADIDDDDLLQQINNRRKQGAFTDRSKKAATAAKAAIKAFGPQGTIEKGLLTGDILNRLYGITNGR